MTCHRARQLRKLYGAVLSVVLVITGICLMYACLNIYQGGAGAFSREIVAEHFTGIAIPVYLCFAMVILGFVLNLFLPTEKEKPGVAKNYPLILEKLHDKTDLTLCSQELQAAVAKEQQGRKKRKILTLVFLSIGSVVFLCYAADGSHFHQQQITDSLIRAMALLIPCMLIPFVSAIVTVYSNQASIRREIDLLKQADANRSPAPAESAKPRKTAVLRYAVLAVALGILIYGYFAGGTADVLTKAINICTECVGLG